MYAQTNASAYSMIGMGDINYNYFDRSTGMGNSGISLSSAGGNYMYLANPASFADLGDMFFKGEISANFKGVNYTGTPMSNSTKTNSSDVQFQKILFGLKVKHFWGMGFGLKQFSSINYNFTGTEAINGSSITVPMTVSGDGGLNQFFWINSFRIAKGLNIGIESSYLFGSQQQEKTTTADGIINSSDLNTTVTSYYHKLYFKGGIQYHKKLNDKWRLGLGLTGSNKTALRGNTTYDLTQGTLGLVTQPTTIVKDSAIGTTKFTLPLTLGAGVSMNYDNKWTFAADYQRQNWKNAGNLNGAGYVYGDAQRFSGGVEYAKKQTIIQNGYVRDVERYFVQFGGYYTQGFLNVNSNRINDFGGTFGIGFNTKQRASYGPTLSYMINLNVGSMGTTNNNLVRQTYYQVGVTLSINDFWDARKRVID
ncbi:MAG: hypothetical protein DI598_01025 [Pseudopedobacter saltans]|uniref:Outer membrane protein n=1 Tax=Pseudopedobacter saltans TaxID=151895 RepID=A0A2W5FAC5_9SPHI|nr:MAG: hypothetical protein DI598_01025 [Pseudopedobacter saltans]